MLVRSSTVFGFPGPANNGDRFVCIRLWGTCVGSKMKTISFFFQCYFVVSAFVSETAEVEMFACDFTLRVRSAFKKERNCGNIRGENYYFKTDAEVCEVIIVLSR